MIQINDEHYYCTYECEHQFEPAYWGRAIFGYRNWYYCDDCRARRIAAGIPETEFYPI